MNEVIVEILRYLVAHPRAKDSISGIEKWWLSRSTSLEGKRKIEESLDLLVSQGWLIARSSPQAETIYSLNEDGLVEINAFLGKEADWETNKGTNNLQQLGNDSGKP